MSGASGALLDALRKTVGRRHVLTGASRTRSFSTGYRVGSGEVAAVVRPRSLVELWRVLKLCVAADHILILQAANTGLTGGSTPNGAYDRPVVIVSTSRLTGIHLLRNGAQAVCLPGATLHQLERMLAPLDREPHSVIGSSCIGASVIGGVCNNSGGALIRRGPAYTEYALFARVGENGAITLHNHLGIELGSDPEAMLQAVQRGAFNDADVVDDAKPASAADYDKIVRDVEAATPARYNADPARLYEASGSAGRVVVFAVRLDTFEREKGSTTFYIGTNDVAELTSLRRSMLRDMPALPITAEYIHRTAFDVASVYGRDIFLAIRRLGTERLPLLFAAKSRLDAWAKAFPLLPTMLSDRLMQWVSRRFPNHLPQRMLGFRDRFEHHLILKVAAADAEETTALLGQMFPSTSGDVFECTDDEAERAFLHRFAVAGAAIRYKAIHSADCGEIIALDIALPRNAAIWFEELPPEIASEIVLPIYYGHFFCHVFHQDYIVRTGSDPEALKQQMLERLDARGAEYPAEHNVGHAYAAKPALVRHYRQLDPANVLNPGLGKTSRKRGWRD